MELSPNLTRSLDALTEVLADPTVDLNVLLANLVEAVSESVDSLLSLTLTVTVDDLPFTLAVAGPYADAAARASVSIPLAPSSDARFGPTLLLLAATAGAFVDLAADMSFALRLAPGAIELDGHIALHDPAEKDSYGAIEDQRVIDQAVGVLIAQGMTVEDAYANLQHRAAAHSTTLVESARDVLAGAVRAVDHDM